MVTHLTGLVTSLTRSPGGPGGGGGHSYRILPVVVCDLRPWPCKLKSFGAVSGETVKVGKTSLSTCFSTDWPYVSCEN